MQRRDFIKFIGGIAVVEPLTARAQQPTSKVPRVGWLVTGSPTTYRFSLAAFQAGLKALGYVEGKNIAVEYRWAQGNVALLPQLASELVQKNVDVIVAGGSNGAEAAKRATAVIPIVAAGVGDLVEIGLAASLARPGGNLTGFVANAPETTAKRFQLIREIIPQTRRAAILRNPTNSVAKLEWNFAKDFSAANNIDLALHDARDAEELTKALANLSQSAPDFFVVLNDPFIFTYRKVIVDAADHFRLPSIYGFREFVDDGGLMSYGTSITDTYRRAAGYVDKIIKGEKPADLPVQLPTKFELVVNVKAAKAIGLTIPDTFLLQADEIIE
jgi:putative ABC transport system substrate-binding protein